MIKIGTADNKALVSLSGTEFVGLTGKTIGNIPDGTNISLAPIKAKVDLVDAKVAELADLKSQCQDMVDKLTSIGV